MEGSLRGQRQVWRKVPLAVAETGRLVHKTTGDYKFRGDVRGSFPRRNGAARVAVENNDGLLHTFSPSQLEDGLSQDPAISLREWLKRHG
jgi:hypothetical protein